MEELVKKTDEVFEILEDDEEEQRASSRNTKGACWVGTWNNPEMTDDEFRTFLEDWYNDDILQFAVFQREKGENTGTIHFQFFINFKTAKYFKWIKKNLPYGCHFKPMRSTKTHCRNYCSKVDTRVSGPYEIGEFIEERGRSDLARALKMQAEGVSFETIEDIFPVQTFMYRNMFKGREEDIARRKFSKICRNVEVTYIYGPSRVGKTSWVLKQYGLDNVFVVDNYGEYQFTGYMGERVVVFDEFIGQVKPITKMNKLLEPYPLKLNIKGGITQARFDKVYIISNSPLKDIYTEDKTSNFSQYDAFLKRINHIVRFDKDGKTHIEKNTQYEDIPEEERDFVGLTRRAVKVFEYDNYGNSFVVYDRYNKVPELQEVANVEVPFENIITNEQLEF